MQKITFNAAGVAVELTGDNERDIFKQAAFWFSLPTECGLCKASLTFDYRTPQTFEYYSLKCTGPTPHVMNLGEKKSSHDLYFDRRKHWEPFRAGAVDEHDAAAANAAADDARSEPEPIPSPAFNRGKALNRILELLKACHDAGINPGDVAHLQQKTDNEIRTIGVRLAGLLAGAKAVAK